VNHFTESNNHSWHGCMLNHKNDGHPVYQIQPLDEYPMIFCANRAQPYWYHTHAHRRTAFQAYYGLASLLIVEDEDERRLTGTSILISGKRYTGWWSRTRPWCKRWPCLLPESYGATDGFLGDTIIANLTYRPYLNVSSRHLPLSDPQRLKRPHLPVAFANSRTSMLFTWLVLMGVCLHTQRNRGFSFTRWAHWRTAWPEQVQAGETYGSRAWHSPVQMMRDDGGRWMMGGGTGQCAACPPAVSFSILSLM